MYYIPFNATTFKINDYDYLFKAQDVAMQCCKNKMTVTGGKRSKTWAYKLSELINDKRLYKLKCLWYGMKLIN